MIVLIFVTVYFVSAFLAYKHVQISHSKDGIYSSLDANISDIILTFTPVLNTVSAIISWSYEYPNRRKNFNSIFKIKK